MEDDEEMKNQCFGGEYLGEMFDHMTKRYVQLWYLSQTGNKMSLLVHRFGVASLIKYCQIFLQVHVTVNSPVSKWFYKDINTFGKL